MIGYIPRLFITYKLLFTYTKKSIFSLFSAFFDKTVFLFARSCYNILVSQTKELKMKKVTQKEWKAYRTIRLTSLGLPSANDNYNIEVYGITAARWSEINRAVVSCCGIMDWRDTSLKEVNNVICFL